MTSTLRPIPDILIVGAGIVGLSLALELHGRGARVTVLERDAALSHASTAAAGMLAVDDPHNPPALLPLSRLSASLYPDFLQRLESISGLHVPFQTDATLQHFPDGTSTLLAEHSLDPRQLAGALLAAVRATSIDLREHTAFTPRITASRIVHATGAWPVGVWPAAPVFPRKGQMLLVALPASLPLRHAVRAEDVYIVPRTLGPNAGRALIGSTIEDAGFDTTTHAADLAHLRARAAELLPPLASEINAPAIASWAGLRPATPDGLPLLGPLVFNPQHFLATGHFRNGILLAPATAVVLADLLEGKPTPVDLSLFAPARFSNLVLRRHPEP